MEPNHLDELLNKYKIPLGVGLVGLVLLIGGVISSGIIPKTFIKSSSSGQPATVRISGSQALLGEAKVDVSGEVVKPGVYSLSRDARVEDALKMAGGVTESADPVFVSKTLNLAQKISDGMKIYVPKAVEAGSSGSPVSQTTTSSTPDAMVNINAASASDLDKLPGVGEVTTQNIINKRPYASIEELVTKKAVTRAVYEKIKSLVSTY